MSSATCMLNWLIDGSHDLLDEEMERKPLADRSRLARLPPEVLQNVLGFYCDEQTALRIAFTCRRLYTSIIGNECLWRHLYERRFHQPSDEDGVRIVFTKCDQVHCRMQLAHARINSADNGVCGCKVDLQPPNGHTSWFGAYASRSRLVRNWKKDQSSFWRVRPLTASGDKLPKQLRILTANDHWALVASPTGVSTKLYLISMPKFNLNKYTDLSEGHLTMGIGLLDTPTSDPPIAYALDWLLPTDGSNDPVQQLGAADMAILSDTHVAIRIPIATERPAAPCAIIVWRLSDRRLTRRLVFQRRTGYILHLLNRWLIFRRFDDHLQKDIDFLCELTSENTCTSHRLEAIPDNDQPLTLLELLDDLHEFDEQEIDNYGGCPPRMMYLPPDVGHFHCTSATIANALNNPHIKRNELKYNAPLIYCCNTLERNQLRWSLVCLRSGKAIVLHSSVCRIYEQEVYLKSTIRISDSRVLLTGARRDPITGCFSTWLAVHHWENNRLLFERGYPRSVRPDAATLIRSHSMEPSSNTGSLSPTINTSTLNLVSEINTSYASLSGSIFTTNSTTHLNGIGTSVNATHSYSMSSSSNRLITSQCQDTGPDLLAWRQIGELMIIDLNDGSIRYHFHHDKPSIGVFRPVVGSLYMLVDDDWRLLLDAATGWRQVYLENDPYAGYKLAGSGRLMAFRQGRLSLVEFEAETRALVDQRSSLRSVFGVLRSCVR
ncbi:hypothetical protein BDF19DRAFT_431572 [Syncephalis fuscata]|nr:hypothetical protein BDF19DRAFT_431572 [Syncephalis fuscata]